MQYRAAGSPRPIQHFRTGIRSAAGRPGVFRWDYDTAGISHVGFYVGLDEAGNPMFLHCGDPIQYARLNTSYWQQHFYAYGRPPYD